MPVLPQGNRAKQLVPAGRVLRVSTTGAASVKAGSAGAVSLSATFQDFGPYASDTVVVISASSKSLDYFLVARDMREVVSSSSAPSDSDGRPEGTVYIQS